MQQDFSISQKFAEDVLKFFGSFNMSDKKIFFENSEIGFCLVVPISKLNSLSLFLEEFYNTYHYQYYETRTFGNWDTQELIAFNFLTDEVFLSIDDFIECLFLDKNIIKDFLKTEK